MRVYKKIWKAFALCSLLFLAVQCGCLSVIPSELVMLRGEPHSLPAFVAPTAAKDGFLLNKEGEKLEITPTETGSFTWDFSALGLVTKTATVNVVEPREVYLGGEAVGIKMYMQGVLVVGLSEIPGTGRTPGQEAGIREGDRILTVNGEPLSGSDALDAAVQESGGMALSLTVARDAEIFEATISPVYYTDGESYKLGLWVKESAAGIGTITFVIPENGQYAALGHAIEDADTGKKVSTASGSITDCEIVHIEKGENGAPGAVRGVFGDDLGSIEKNMEMGLYGTLQAPENDGIRLPVAVSSQVQRGTAVLYSDIAGGTPEGYTVEIERILHKDNPGTKSMVLRVTDERLLRLTGGIIQGMSGSPLEQNGKLIGAVTHVFVNDPTRGYGIFIENMLTEINK
ncbi:MAG: SpoIVB peptidase [Ruminococcaceae bacterium]|nr:SpoIVB peptidase [Oscillospiraceae bacterium]